MEPTKQLSLEHILEIFDYPDAYEKDYVFAAMESARKELKRIPELEKELEYVKWQRNEFQKQGDALFSENEKLKVMLGKESRTRETIDKTWTEICEAHKERADKAEKENKHLTEQQEIYLFNIKGLNEAIDYLSNKVVELSRAEVNPNYVARRFQEENKSLKQEITDLLNTIEVNTHRIISLEDKVKELKKANESCWKYINDMELKK